MRVLSRLFRRLFLVGLAEAHAASRLAFFAELEGLGRREAFAAQRHSGGRTGSLSQILYIQTSMRATEALVGSSSGDGQPRHVKIIDAGGVAAGDLGLFVVRHAGHDLPRLRKRRFVEPIMNRDRTPLLG